MPRILVVEDERIVTDVVRESLEAAGFDVRSAKDGRSGLEVAESWRPDLVVLDLKFPTQPSGADVCRTLRAEPSNAQLFIVVLTGLRGDELEAELFDAGADDYVRKEDFRPAAFARRVQAILSRSTRAQEEGAVALGPLELDTGRMEARIEGKRLPLTPTEFDVLRQLAASPERPVAREELLEHPPEGEGGQASRAVDMHIRQLRKKLMAHAGLIQTVYGVGYQFVPEGGPMPGHATEDHA